MLCLGFTLGPAQIGPLIAPLREPATPLRGAESQTTKSHVALQRHHQATCKKKKAMARTWFVVAGGPERTCLLTVSIKRAVSYLPLGTVSPYVLLI